MARNTSWFGWMLSKGKTGGIAATSKQVLHQTFETTLKSGATSTGQTAAAGLAMSGSTAVHMAMMGGIGVVSAVANQLEYLDERNNITNFYREEMAAKGGKDLKKVGDADLTAAEKTNSTINGAVKRERSKRNLGVAASFLASVIVYGLMLAVVPDYIGQASAMFSNPTVSAIGEFCAKVALGGLAYLATKVPITQAGSWLFGLDKSTTHDLIVEMSMDRERGKAITREQAVEVFVSGNKQIANHVKSTFGKDYEDLTIADKVRVSSELAKVLPVDKIVHNINLGTAKASELAYTVQGDMSGVLPKAPDRGEHVSTLEKFAGKCKQMMHSIGNMFAGEQAETIEELKPAQATQADKKHAAPVPEEDSPIVELNHGKSHVEQLGPRHKHHGDHREQLAMQRTQPVVMPGSPTLQ